MLYKLGICKRLVDASNISMYGFILATISSIFGIIMVMQRRLKRIHEW
ncbi:MAG: hypothetical protein R2799_13810 [Crocinitomicaceae bacterium]